jgi:hypothetical protein
LLPALEKVHRLERRLEELVPDAELDSVARIERLVNAAREMSPEAGYRENDLSFVRLLERLGDKRAGFEPIDETPLDTLNR